MRFYEYEAKVLFARHGAPLPRGRMARTAAEALIKLANTPRQEYKPE